MTSKYREVIMKRIYSLLFFCFVLTLASCSSKPEALIIGKWKSVDGLNMIEFFQDGSVKITGDIASGKKSLEGTFKLVDDQHLKIDGGLGMEFKMEVSQDELILTDPQGKTTKYQKVKWFA
jgi:hypothetical protein